MALPMSVLGWLWRAWQAVWDFEVEARQYDRLRIGVGLLFAVIFLTLVPHAELLFDGTKGIPVSLMRTTLHGARLDWFDHLEGAEVYGVLVLGTVASLLFAAGVVPRIAAVVVYLIHLNLQYRNYAWMDGSDDLLRTLLFYLWFVPWRRGATSYAGWPLRLVQIQVATLYLATALFKAQGTDWWPNASALYWGLSDPRWARFPMDAVVQSGWGQRLLEASTLGTLALELLLPVLLLWPRTRRWGVVSGILLHAGIHLTMVVGLFSPSMLVSYLAFWEGDLWPWRRPPRENPG